MKFLSGGCGSRGGAHGSSGGSQGGHGGSRGGHGGSRGGSHSGGRGRLRGGFRGGSRSDVRGGPANPPPPRESSSLVRDIVTYADATRSPPAADHSQPGDSEWQSVSKRRRLSESKLVCKKCLRSSHTSADCRHQLTCRRCAGAGHVAAHCPRRSPRGVEDENPRQRSKKPQIDARPLLNIAPSLTTAIASPDLPLIRVSLPISEEINKTKEELRKMIIIRVSSGNVSVNSLMTHMPKIFYPGSIVNITPYDDEFILTMNSSRSAVQAVKRNPLSFSSKHGECTIILTPWTPEFKSHSLAAGNYQWIRISNLPMHCWNWDSIVSVLRPIGDLIYVQKREEASMKFLRMMARLKKPIVFPMQMVVDVGMRSFFVMLEDCGTPSLRSKISHGSSASVKPLVIKEPSAAPRMSPAGVANPSSQQVLCSYSAIPCGLIGKAPESVPTDIDIPGKRVELGSASGHSMMLIPTKEVGISGDRPVSPGDQREVSSLSTGGASSERGNSLCMAMLDVPSSCAMVVALPRDQLSHMLSVSMHTSGSLPRDLVAPLDADPSA